MTEAVPTTDVLDLFDAQWDAGNVTEPVFQEANEPSQELNVDLLNGDHVIGRADFPGLEENPIGNWKYSNRTYRVLLEVYSRNSRQRLYDLMAEIRRLCHEQRHLMTNFQRIQFVTFTEETQTYVNIWMGRVIIELVNSAVLTDGTA